MAKKRRPASRGRKQAQAETSCGKENSAYHNPPATRQARRLERRREWQRRYRKANPERARELSREGSRRERAARFERDREGLRPIRGAPDYEAIKTLAKRLHRPAHTLIGQAMDTDPFYVTPGRVEGAEWFAKIWKRLKFGSGIHTRKIHYVIVSQNPPLRNLRGTPYENTKEDFRDLNRAVRDARILGLIPSDHFIDRRNNEPIIHVSGGEISADVWTADASPHVEQTASLAMPDLPRLVLTTPTIPQRYHVELWCEKTTVNQVLEPLAQRYGCNVITGAGELSLTACELVVERALESERPVRILYISDFDPSGDNMPVSVARKIEHRLRRDRLDLDIQVRPIVLTVEQCERYRLPRTPIKETDKRANRFEERFGAGATELDALEALHPGELSRIVEREIQRYYDGTLSRRISQIAGGIMRDINALNRDAHQDHRNAINELESEWNQIAEDHATAIEAWIERAETTWDAIASELDERLPDLDEIEWPKPDDGDEDDDPLFDSSRDYVEQIDRYKKHQDKLTARKGNGGAS